jgi:hypothetical protein
MAQIIVTVEKIQKQGVRSWTPTSAISMAIDVGDHYDITPNGTGSTIFNTLTNTEYTTTNSASSVATLIERANRSDDYMKRVAAGEVTGQFAVNKFGQNTSIDSGTEEEIWDGSVSYSFPLTATITHIRQATDQVGTDGGITIEVQGLNANWDLTVQNVVLDAVDTTTEVVLGTPLIRVFRMKVLAFVSVAADLWVGATGVGAITAKAIIAAGNNQTLMAIYTVPAGCTAYMTCYYAHVNPATNLDPTSNPIKLWARDNANGYERQIKHVVGQTAGGFQHFFTPNVKYTEKTDIIITAQPVGKAADVSAGFDLIVELNA